MPETAVKKLSNIRRRRVAPVNEPTVVVVEPAVAEPTVNIAEPVVAEPVDVSENAKDNSTPARHYCFTLNNYTPEEASAVLNNAPDKCRYVIYGFETSKSGTPHLQGYMELHVPMRLTGVKKLPGCAHMHLEQRKGTRNQARTYCMKDGDFRESGDWKTGGQGARTDLKALKEAIYAGATWASIMEDFTDTVAKYMRFAEKCFQIASKKRAIVKRDVKVFVHYGTAGTGKSESVHMLHPDVFTVNCKDSFPFDGYAGERVILMDEFYGSMSYQELLRILEGYQLRLNIKGGHTYANWDTVYLVSNNPPHTWYPNVGMTDAFIRRIDGILKFDPFVIPEVVEDCNIDDDVVDAAVAARYNNCNEEPEVILNSGSNLIPHKAFAAGMQRLILKNNNARGNFAVKIMPVLELREFRGHNFDANRDEKWETKLIDTIN